MLMSSLRTCRCLAIDVAKEGVLITSHANLTGRDNEVTEDHPVYEFIANLELSGVETMNVHLGGLSKDDLNQMISESLCLLPRFCRPLSDIVYEKTKGNPFFALEFLKSLVDNGLLEYSLRERRWIWDAERIYSETPSPHVLYLITRKMALFPEQLQFCLKLMSCFGIKVEAAIVGYLTTSTSQFMDFQHWLDQAVKEGCIQRTQSSDFVFVHDKVREAAYCLIPDETKQQVRHGGL